MKQTILLGNTIIEYDLQRKKVKNINLRIRCDGSISLSADKNVSIGRIESFMTEKSSFILSGIARMEKRRPVPAREVTYITGDIFPIGGMDYFLDVVAGPCNQVLLEKERIVVTVKADCTAEKKARLVEQFLSQRYYELLTDSCKKIYTQFAHLGIPFPEIAMRRMTARWGSCNPVQCKLTLNRALAKAPFSCIDYVVTHEFVHFIHQNHSSDFYKALSIYYPQWQEEKERLNSKQYL